MVHHFAHGHRARLISLLFSGLKLGIDFTGGTLWEVRFSQPASALDIESALGGAGLDSVIVQQSGSGGDETFLIRMPEVPEGSPRKAELAKASNRESDRSPNLNIRPSAAPFRLRFAIAP